VEENVVCREDQRSAVVEDETTEFEFTQSRKNGFIRVVVDLGDAKKQKLG
jgi:hypothetical protein